MDFKKLCNIAINAASAAGRIILQHVNDDVSITIKKEGGQNYSSQVVTIVDKKSEAAILSELLPTCYEYDIALLSEETEDDGSRFKKDFYWCIDPMDGTLAFINKHHGFCVSIALVSKDGTPHIGIVYDPTTDNMYHAVRGTGAYKNGRPWIIKNTNKHLSYMTDKKLKDTPQVAIIENSLTTNMKKLNLDGVKEIAGAGAVLNAILVLENGPAMMMKLPKKENGGGSLWDYAATSCIYHELGLPATNYNKETLDLNRRDSTFMNHQGIYFANLINDK